MFIHTGDLHPRSQPRQGLHVYRSGPTGSPPAELVKPVGTAASQMRPDVPSGRSVSINMQPLTGLGTSVGEVRCRKNSIQLKVHSSPTVNRTLRSQAAQPKLDAPSSYELLL